MGGVTLGVALALGVYAWKIAPSWLEVVRLRVGVPGLPAELAGVRVAHLSDFHAGGPGVSIDMLWDARHAAEAFLPDVIAITGDFYQDGRPFNAGGLFDHWPARTPVVAVLGNHDHRGGAENVRRLLEELDHAGIVVLRNASTRVAIRARDVWIAGVDDPYSWRADDTSAFNDVPDGEPVLLYLAHSPAAITTMPFGRASLLLAGHTHGGQLRVVPSGRIPLEPRLRRVLRAPARRDPPFFRGIHWMRGAVVVVSNGLGVSRLPLRFRTRPQVILIELQPAPRTGAPCDDVARYVSREPGAWRWLSWLS
jgi:predicted MPP superfamily phosphohydrolase